MMMQYSFFLLMFALFACSCSSIKLSNRVKIKGSDTMLYLMELLAREYMLENPKDVIYVEGGGSASGVKALIQGEIDICTASRKLNPDEIMKLTANYGSVGISYLIAKDALCIYVHLDNPVENFTYDDLKRIYLCEITNWSYLGGRDLKIVPFIRNTNSGTYHYFKQHILEGEEYCNSSVAKPTTKIIVDDIIKNPGAVGYGGIGYGSGAKYAAINGVYPSEENVRKDVYPITRYLHFYVLQEPRGAVKRFIDWVLSAKGQSVINLSGYVPLWDVKQ